MNDFLLGGITIRYSRVRKFSRRGRHLITVIKLMAAWYLLIGISALLTGNTNALFTDTERISAQISAGIWQSSLSLTDEETKEHVLSATVINIGADMEDPGYYEVLHTNLEDPENNETLMQGEIPILAMNDSFQLEFEAQINGIYQFKVYLEDGGLNAKWSQPLEVSVFEESVTPEEETEKEETDGENEEKKTEETGNSETPQAPETPIKDVGDQEGGSEEEPAESGEQNEPIDPIDESQEQDSPKDDTSSEPAEETQVVTEPPPAESSESDNNQVETQEGD